jgi:hypothetical protein
MARTERPIRVFYSELSGRFYASQHYREVDRGCVGAVEGAERFYVVITGKKYDVTNDIAAAVVKHDLEFTPVPTDG